jgi:TonB family protein
MKYRHMVVSAILVALACLGPQMVNAEPQPADAGSPAAIQRQCFHYVIAAKRQFDVKVRAMGNAVDLSNSTTVNQLKAVVNADGTVTSSQLLFVQTPFDKWVKRELDGMNFGPLPPGVKLLDILWTLTSGGGKCAVDFTDSPTAKAYYREKFGLDYVPQMIRMHVSLLDGDSSKYAAYLADLQKRIKKAWIPPFGAGTRPIIIDFSITKNGELAGASVKQSSVIEGADKAAIKALQLASPFRPLPDGANRQSFECSFDENLLVGL